MANPYHLSLLNQGSSIWNKWRQANPTIKTDLIGADLSGANLREVDLWGANLGQANLFSANLSKAILISTDLTGANLSRADLNGADLSEANLFSANLSEAILSNANLTGTQLKSTNLCGANFSESSLWETVFVNTNLMNAKSLDICRHGGPSTLDFRTLQQSGSLPSAFLRGCGLPDLLIDYLPSLLNQPIQFYSCFISYSSDDEDFAQRLHADLQSKDVRCWFAPNDGKGGENSMSRSVRLFYFMRNCY